MNNDSFEKNSIMENFKVYYKSWCVYSQIHGLSFIARAKRLANRLIWIVVFILCSVFCLNSLIRITFQYFSNAVIAGNVILIEIPTVFPAITICEYR